MNAELYIWFVSAKIEISTMSRRFSRQLSNERRERNRSVHRVIGDRRDSSRSVYNEKSVRVPRIKGVPPGEKKASRAHRTRRPITFRDLSCRRLINRYDYVIRISTSISLRDAWSRNYVISASSDLDARMCDDNDLNSRDGNR